MPQPFLGSWLPTPDACAKRPALAAHIGVIASLWSNLEYLLGCVEAAILQVDARIGTLIYSSVKSEAARLDIIKNIANEYLDKNLSEEYIKLQKAIKKTGSERDKVIHGLWGLPLSPFGSDEFFADTDSLILADPRDFVAMKAAWTSLLAKSEKDRTDKDHVHLETKQRPPALEYRENDFTDIEVRIKQRTHDLTEFGAKVVRFHAQ